jgi:hypothetical protein
MTAIKTHGPGPHLETLAATLTAAQAQDSPDPGELAGHAWKLLAELNDVSYQLEAAGQQLTLLTTAAQAAVADRGSDPLGYLRDILRDRGQLPPRHVNASVVIAWPGNAPSRRRRYLHWLHRPRRLAAHRIRHAGARPVTGGRS